MIAVEPVATGDSRKRVAGGRTSRNAQSATGCPGVAASFPIWLFGAREPKATVAVEVRYRKIANRQPALANAVLVYEYCRARAIIAPPPAVTKSSVGNHEPMRLGVAGPKPHSILTLRFQHASPHRYSGLCRGRSLGPLVRTRALRDDAW